MGYTTIQIEVETRKRLALLKAYERETYDQLLNMLLDLVPTGDDEGEYTEEFRASMLRSLYDIRQGRVHTLKEAKQSLGIK